jgi:hypothetical protein
MDPANVAHGGTAGAANSLWTVQAGTPDACGGFRMSGEPPPQRASFGQ